MPQHATERGLAYARGRFMALDEPAIPVDDRAHQFGDGVYEAVRVYGGRPFLLERHLERFARSAEFIRLVPDRPSGELKELILEAIERSGLSEALVYFQLSRGVAKREHVFPDVRSHLSLTVRPVDDSRQRELRTRGQKVVLAEDVRWKYCFVKSLNLLPNVLAKQEAVDRGANDALFVRDGIVTEGSSSNVFLVRDGELWTHPANERILHGVTRALVLQLARDLGIRTREEGFSPDALFLSDEVFTTSTVAEIVPVVSVDGRPMGSGAFATGSAVRRIANAFSERVRDARVE